MKITDIFDSYFIRSGPARRYPGVKTRSVTEDEVHRILDHMKKTVYPRGKSTFRYGRDEYMSILSETDRRIIAAFDSFRLPPSATGDYEFDQLTRQLKQHIDKEVGDWIKSKVGGDFVRKAHSLYGSSATVDNILSNDDFPEHKKIEFMYIKGAEKLMSFLNVLDANMMSAYRWVKG